VVLVGGGVEGSCDETFYRLVTVLGCALMASNAGAQVVIGQP
jgi:hypothetical protein